MRWELLLSLIAFYVFALPLALWFWLWRQSSQLKELKHELSQLRQRLASKAEPKLDAATTAVASVDQNAVTKQAITSQAAATDPVARPDAANSNQAHAKGWPRTQHLQLDQQIVKQLEQPSNSQEVSKQPWLIWLEQQLANGRWLAALGLSLSLLGVVLLLRLAIDQGYLPLELRLGLVSFTAILGLGFGYRLTASKPLVALPLQGLCLTLLLLCIYVGGQWLSLYPASLSLSLLSLIILLACLLAYLQTSQSLAFFALIGGFASPILASTGQGEGWMLFSYYGLLNLGILGLAWFFAWRWLTQAAIALSVLAAYGYGLWWYQAEDWLWAQSLLLAYWALYLALAWLWLQKKPEPSLLMRLVLLPALAGFGLQFALLPATGWVAALVCLGYGALYAAITALGLRQGWHRQQRMSLELCWLLALIFASLAIPLALAPKLGISLWLIEAGLLYYFAMQQVRVRQGQLGMQVLAVVLGWLALGWLLSELNPSGLANPWLWLVVLALALLGCRRLPGPWPRWFRPKPQPAWLYLEYLLLALLSLGLFNAWPISMQEPTGLLMLVLALGVMVQWQQRAKPRALRAWLLLPCLGLFIPWFVPSLLSWLMPQPGVWHILVASHLGLCLLLLAKTRLRIQAQALSLLLSTVLAVLWLASLQIGFSQSSLELAWQPWLLLLASAGLSSHYYWRSKGGDPWPVNELLILSHWAWLVLQLCHGLEWLSGFAWPMALAALALLQYHPLSRSRLPLFHWLLLGSMLLNLSLDAAWPQGYLPLLNPLDLASLLLLGLSLKTVWQQPKGPAIWGLSLWLWLSTLLGRSLGQGLVGDSSLAVWWSLPWAQFGLSLLWAGSALGLMIWSKQQGLRKLWWLASLLLALTVVKLLLFDMSNEDTLARILSFIGVGALIWLAAWLAPLAEEHANDQSGPANSAAQPQAQDTLAGNLQEK